MQRNEIESLIDSADCLLAKPVLQQICGAICDRSLDCNMLVFGLGGDSVIWSTVNRGYTLFVEDDPRWLEKYGSGAGDLDIVQYQYRTRSNPNIPIHKQPPVDIAMLEQHQPPRLLTEFQWDIILVDGPIGSYPDSPGRSLPIYWTSKLCHPQCDVFVDDYSRPVEFIYTNVFLFHRYRRFRIFDIKLQTLWLQAATARPDQAAEYPS